MAVEAPRPAAFRRASRALALGLGVLALSCSPALHPAPGPEPRAGGEAGPVAQWTVLVYMAADNNLDASALVNLEQMAAVGSTDDVRVVVQVDRGRGAEGGVLNLPRWETTKRLYVERRHLRELADLGPTDMADPRVLQDFIAWASTAYPAKRYALVLWNHGGAWSGFGVDEGANRDAPMAIPALAGALNGAGVAFDVLGFDACLMATLEVALELAPHGRSLIASEEAEPALGWDYAAVLTTLARNPAMDHGQLGRVIVDAYVANIRRRAPEQSRYITLSVIDLRRMATVKAAFRTFAGALRRWVEGPADAGPSERLARIGQVFGRARHATPAFGRTEVTDPGLTFDLGRLLDNSMRAVNDAAVTRAASGLRRALRGAVSYSAAGEGLEGAAISGISIFVPVGLAGSELATRRDRAYGALVETAETAWPALVRAFADAVQRDRQKPGITGPAATATTVIPGRTAVTVSGTVTDETMVAGVVIGIVGLAGAAPVMFTLDERPRTYARSNEYSYTFDGSAWYLSGAGGAQPVFTVQWQRGQRAVFGRYQQHGGASPTRAYFVFDETTGKVIYGFDVAAGAIGALLPGERSLLEPFLFTPDLRSVPGPPVTIKNARLTRAPLPAGPYVVSVTGFDLAGNAATGGTIVTVTPSTSGTWSVPRCEPTGVDAVSRHGAHVADVTVTRGQPVGIELRLDRNRIGEVRYETAGDPSGHAPALRIVGPDGRSEATAGEGPRASGVLTPRLSGTYRFELSTQSTGPRTGRLTWTIAPPPAAVALPPTIDLDLTPERIAALEEPGLHVAAITVPARKELTLSLDLEVARTPWLGYSIDVGLGSPPLMLRVLGTDGTALAEQPGCGLHMGGFALSRTGEYRLVFDNRGSDTDRRVTVWLEGFRPEPPR